MSFAMATHPASRSVWKSALRPGQTIVAQPEVRYTDVHQLVTVLREFKNP